MNRTYLLLAAFSMAALGVASSGCVGEVMQQAQTAAKRKLVFEELKALGATRIVFHDQTRRFPKSWDELQSAGLSPSVRQALEAEGYTVILGMGFQEMTAGSSTFMHAFRRDAAQKGGLVGLADGSVREITSEEFAELWKNQEPTMKNAVILEPPAAAAPASGSGSGGGGSGPPPPPPAASGSY